MSQKEIKAIYNSLLETEEFSLMFPSLKGDWEKDKKIFKALYDNSQEILEDTSLDFDTEEEEENLY